MRINKFIASFSQYSRRKADELIKSGQVFLNGEKVTQLGIEINPKGDQIKIGGEVLQQSTEKIYLVLNKPQNYVTTRSDEHGRATVMELVPKIKNLKPIGRLDRETEGLLLFSNDGDFINLITHPSFSCEKEYYAKINGQLSPEEKTELEKGITIDNKKTSPAKIHIIKSSDHETHLKIAIREGRNRQIRKMFASIHHPVKYLERIRIGAVTIKSLPKGGFRHLTSREINDYKSLKPLHNLRHQPQSGQ